MLFELARGENGSQCWHVCIFELARGNCVNGKNECMYARYIVLHVYAFMSTTTTTTTAIPIHKPVPGYAGTSFYLFFCYGHQCIVC